jgi:GT2 family glycosyltransferase
LTALPISVDCRTGPSLAATVGVVITTYNHAHFLQDALGSVFLQTRPPDAVIVVDDGSTDEPGRVVSYFPEAQLVRQENRGLAAARNTGLSALNTSFVVFLDADDRLEPRALERGLACFARVPDSGFVYGGHKYIDAAGREIGERFEAAGDDPYLHLLRRNFIAMHGTVMYRRDLLLAEGGFDETLRRCEDYDMYLRLARRYPVTGYADLVAAYRQHRENMSADYGAMLRSALDVHRRHAPSADDEAARRAWREGRRGWRRCYAGEMAEALYRNRQRGATLAESLPLLLGTAVASPSLAVRQTLRGLRRRLSDVLPPRIRARLVNRRDRIPAPGEVRFGDLRRVRPISREFGFDRGLPVDRYYIERFLERHASEVAGRVLEIGDDAYTRRFGGGRVSRSDVLHVHGGNPRATLVGDLTDPRVLPEGAFDCIILTQTLQLIFDVRLAVACLHRALAPGGVVLVTAPGISPIDRGEWGRTWFWSFTAQALERMFGEVFGRDALVVERYGNVFAATAFLQGLAVQELDTKDLDPVDDAFPVIVALRARKNADLR